MLCWWLNILSIACVFYCYLYRFLCLVKRDLGNYFVNRFFMVVLDVLGFEINMEEKIIFFICYLISLRFLLVSGCLSSFFSYKDILKGSSCQGDLSDFCFLLQIFFEYLLSVIFQLGFNNMEVNKMWFLFSRISQFIREIDLITENYIVSLKVQ